MEEKRHLTPVTRTMTKNGTEQKKKKYIKLSLTRVRRRPRCRLYNIKFNCTVAAGKPVSENFAVICLLSKLSNYLIHCLYILYQTIVDTVVMCGLVRHLPTLSSYSITYFVLRMYVMILKNFHILSERKY